MKLSTITMALALAVSPVLVLAEQYIPKVGEVFSYKDISQDIYAEKAENKKNDPANSIFAAMREKRKVDIANPNAPQAFSGTDLVQPEFNSSTSPWQALEAVFPSDWDGIKAASATELAQLRSAVKVKTVMNHPDFKIIEMALAPGALLPRFSDAAPGSFHVLEGAVEVTVDAETIAAYTGTSVKLESLSQRRMKVVSDKPAKILWFRWAPAGDQTYLNYGYYLTGCNFHAQPLEAVMPADFEQWDESERQRFTHLQHSAVAEPAKDSFYGVQIQQLTAMKHEEDSVLLRYPLTPLFSNEKDVQWLDFTKIDAKSFFWSKDAAKGGDLLAAWDKIVRMKGIFQAKVPEQLYDFNMSYIANGPKGKYVTHSHATPEFYYILGGETQWLLNGETYTAVAGNVYFHSPYWDHEMLGMKEGTPKVAITGSWSPHGDRSVFAKPMVFTEALTMQASSAVFSDSFNFHDFKLKQGLTFDTKQSLAMSH
ncbi:cupin domain-containing protein [Moritella marina ATCC 15381]|uniref:Cupin domain-containing protein n=1 Tax=Moritella marina ATCC 15381 TaxID=1202962 RepID=A0A5J6WGE9_MORMI|nr:cupin domain-containing protein [Moritella marina]QFI37083.1 cupin domain-containing protein [Moritella marina ATCC 15381]